MRKTNGKILFAILIVLAGLLIFCGKVEAATYYGRGFEVTIPDGSFNVEAFQDEIEATSTNGGRNYVSINVDDVSSSVAYDESYLELLIRAFENRYGSNFRLISSNVVEKSNCTGIEMQFRHTQTGTYVYVDVYYFKSDNYDYSLYFMSVDRSFITSAEKQQIYSSFKIKDTVTRTNGIPFTDVSKSSWYYSAVKFVSESNIIKGLNDYTFAPSQNLTRGMLVTILHRMEGSPSVSGTSKFSDVQNTSQYYYNAVKWATQKGIVSGYNNGKFGPNDQITREQLAVILSKYSKYKGIYRETNIDLSNYQDSNKISSFARSGMNWAVASGVITGTTDGRLKPQGTATRAEAASMLYKFCTKVK